MLVFSIVIYTTNPTFLPLGYLYRWKNDTLGDQKLWNFLVPSEPYTDWKCQSIITTMLWLFMYRDSQKFFFQNFVSTCKRIVISQNGKVKKKLQIFKILHKKYLVFMRWFVYYLVWSIRESWEINCNTS